MRVYYSYCQLGTYWIRIALLPVPLERIQISARAHQGQLSIKRPHAPRPLLRRLLAFAVSIRTDVDLDRERSSA